jgi:hypothetical protein
MFEIETGHSPAAPASSAFEDLTALLRLIGDDKTYQKRLDQFMAASTRAREEAAGAERAQAALAQRVAEIDKREAKIAEAEVDLHTRKRQVEGQHAKLFDHARHLDEVADQIKLRLLRYAGVLGNFNPKLQSIPDWAAVDRELAMPRDVHMDGNDTTTERGEATITEAVPNAMAGATITRSRPSTAAERKSLRRGVEH